MFIERLINAAPSRPQDRRCSERLRFPAELALLWHHDPASTIRYEVLDASGQGYRIHSGAPLPDGLTGTAVRMLPEGRPLNQSVMVIWCRPASDEGYEVGLQSFSVQ